MATLAELQAAQAAAGAAYAAAAAAYHAAFVELHAYDLAVGNRNLGAGAQPTFNNRPQVLPHPRFYPLATANLINGPVKGNDVSTRLDQILATFSPG